MIHLMKPPLIPLISALLLAPLAALQSPEHGTLNLSPQEPVRNPKGPLFPRATRY